jgi:hypothetical protein
MNNLNRILVLSSAALLALAAVPNSAIASGSGSTGTVDVTTGTPLTFSQVQPINGSLPTYSGTYTMTHSLPGYYPMDTLQLNFKGKPINLPDGAYLLVTVYTSDSLTGTVLPTLTAPPMPVLAKVGLEKTSLSVVNPMGSVINRRVDLIVLSLPDGTIVAVAN